MAESTEEQRKAIRAFIDGTLLPLIGGVLEKKLTQAALFIRDQLALPSSQQWLQAQAPEQFAEWAAGNAKPSTVDWMAGWDACRVVATGAKAVRTSPAMDPQRLRELEQERGRRAGGVAVDGPPKIEAWPKDRVVGRMGDMGPPGRTHMTVMLDGDSDALVSIWQQENSVGEGQLANIEFCTGFGGGGSPRTRAALIALMVAMEADNAESPRKQWPPAEGRTSGVSAAPAPSSVPWPKPSDRDWKEDGQQYMNLCGGCSLAFSGHKRRNQCKVCADGVPPAPGGQQP